MSNRRNKFFFMVVVLGLKTGENSKNCVSPELLLVTGGVIYREQNNQNISMLLIFIWKFPLNFAVPSETERCLSGRKGRFAKPLYELKLVPRVRIPPSPQDQTNAPAFGGAFLFGADARACSQRMRKTKMEVSVANGIGLVLSPHIRDRRSQSLPLRNLV